MDEASHLGNIKSIRLLLEYGADVNAYYGYGDRIRPLHEAAWYGHIECMQLLLKKRAKMNAKDSLGRTPLSLAAEIGREQVVRLLLKKGAKVDARAKSLAIQRKHHSIAEILRAVSKRA